VISSKRHRNLLPLPAITNRLIGVEGDTDANVVDTGDATADRGDTTADRGDTTADRGDTTADRGDTTADRSDTTADRNDTTADRSDTTVDRGDTTADRSDVGVIPAIPAYAGAVASMELRRSRDGNVNPALSTPVDDKIGWAEDRTTRICSMSPEFAESAQPSDTCIFGAGVYQPGPGQRK
jgi:hypothetical protein